MTHARSSSSCKKTFERALEHTFRQLGAWIGEYPVWTTVLSLVIAAVMSGGMYWFEEVNNVRTEYSPDTAPSRKEYAVAKAFLNQNGTLDPSYVMVQAKDGGSLMRDEYRDMLIVFTKYLQDNVTAEYKGVEYVFRSLCDPYCEINTAFLAFLKLYQADDSSTHTYPSIDIFGTQAFIGNNVFGVTTSKDNDTGEVLLESFDTAVLPFFLVTEYETSEAIYHWLVAARKSFPQWTKLNIEVTGDAMVGAEVRRMGLETAPLLIASVVLMIVFVVASSFRRDPSRAKPWESLAGCLIPLLALLASTGLLSACGLKFQSIIVASLFLVLSVGVDDVFIILRAWDRTSAGDTIPVRMAITLEEAGPSITISSITNVMAFFIGISSSTPAVRSFSLFSAVAITVCYFYQLILFSAILALSGRRERSGRQSLLCCIKADPNARSSMVEYVVKMQNWVIGTWCRIISSWTARILLLIFMIGYYYISAIGCLQIRTLISIEKMALPDSYLQDFQHQFENALMSMQPISIYIMNPGDLRNEERMAGVKTIVTEFENATHSYGPSSTFFWLPVYEDFLRFYSDSEEFTYTEIPKFFETSSYFFLKSFVKYNESACLADQPHCIASFFLMTGFHDVIKYHELIPVVSHWRAIAAAHPDYHVYTYSDHAPFVDQTSTIDSTVWSSVGAALLCTAVACFFFIPNLVCILCAVFSVFSITVGIIGLLSLWGIDLDPLSMAALLMAIGFSVDFSSHICYHYYKSKRPLAIDRLEEALWGIGWPIVQVGLSTIVAVSPLLLKQSYLAIVFLKTIVVVVLLGMFHGLVVLPALLTMLMRKKNSPSNSSTEVSSERSSQRSAERRKDSFYKTQQLINKINKELGLSKQTVQIAPISLEEASIRPAFTHHIALGRTPSTNQ